MIQNRVRVVDLSILFAFEDLNRIVTLKMALHALLLLIKN